MSFVNKTINPYDWIELAGFQADGNMLRHHYVHMDDAAAIGQWRKKFANQDIFTSICRYDSADHNSAFIAPLFFDIDAAGELAAAQKNTMILCEMLREKAFIPPESLEIYFSGQKGFHILVLPMVFGGISSPHLLGLNKRLAEKAIIAGVDFIDQGIYTQKRLWRLANSIHSKSGLFKIPLTYEELRDLDIAGILKLARTARSAEFFTPPTISTQTAEWYRQALQRYSDQKSVRTDHKQTVTLFKKGWRMPPCIKAVEQALLPDGQRHAIYLTLARYYAYLNMHPEEIRERIITIDQRNPVHDPDSIGRLVSYGYQHPGFPGCQDSGLSNYCRADNCFYAQLKGIKA